MVLPMEYMMVLPMVLLSMVTSMAFLSAKEKAFL